MTRHKVGNVVSVLHSFVRLSFMKILLGDKIGFSLIERISPNVVIDIDKQSSCILGNRVRIHSGSRITAAKGGTVKIGNNVRINNNCRIACRDSIFIDDGAEFGPGVLIYDHDHDFRAEGGIKSGTYKTGPVKIGKNTWIGANTIILRGSEIGDNCVVGAGSVISGKYGNCTVIIQKRSTEVSNWGGGYRLKYISDSLLTHVIYIRGMHYNFENIVRT